MSQQQGNDLRDYDPEATTKDTVTSQQGSTIEDKLKYKLRKELDKWDRVELDLENGTKADFMAIDFVLDKLTPVIQAIITTETTKARIDETMHWLKADLLNGIADGRYTKRIAALQGGGND